MSESRSGLVTTTQAVCAVALSAAVFLALMALARLFGRQAAFEDGLFGNWSLFVCLLLTFWALGILFTRRLRSRRRARTIAGSRVDDGADFSTEALVEQLRAAARRGGDTMLADRATHAFAHIRRTGDTASTAELLRAEAEAAQGGLENGYLPVRVFLWAIPLLGLVGSVTAIGQAARSFATFAAGARQVDDLRNDLVRLTANLGGAFETTMAALLLALIVMVAMMLLQQKERALLQDVDDFCRLRLLPLMLSDRSVEIRENRATAEALELLRAENAEAYRRNTEQARIYLKRTVKLNETLMEKLDAIASRRRQAPASAPPVPGLAAHSNGAGAALDAQRAGELRATLEDVRDRVREMKPFLDRMAENLRHHAGSTSQPSVAQSNSNGAAVGAD